MANYLLAEDGKALMSEPGQGLIVDDAVNTAFENAAGFDVSGNSVSRNTTGAYFGTVDSVQSFAADGWFSWRFNSVQAGMKVQLSDGTNNFQVNCPTTGGINEFRLNDGYLTDGNYINTTSVYKLGRVGSAINFYIDGVLAYTWTQSSSGIIQLFVLANNEAVSTGAGINTVTNS